MVQYQLHQYVWFGEFCRFVLQVLVCDSPPFVRHTGKVEAPSPETIVSKWDRNSHVPKPVRFSSTPSRIICTASPARNIEKLLPS